jgi:ABC-type uncharacterized transport system permease subunit
MNSFVVFKKTVLSHTLYLHEAILQNLSILVQGIVAINVGIYFNSISNEFLLPVLLTYYIGVILINSFQRGTLLGEFETEISNGVIGNYLAKPINFIYYKLLKEFSSKFYLSFFNLAIIFVIMVLFFQMPFFSFDLILRAVLILPFTLINFYLILAIFLYLALIFEKVSDLYRMFGMSAFFIGGGFIPASNFPEFLGYLPHQFLFARPLEFITLGVFKNFEIGVFYIIFYIILIFLLHNFTMKKLETNGG